MHHISLHPGFVATIVNHKTDYGCEDVNLLSRHVCKFNDARAVKSVSRANFVKDFFLDVDAHFRNFKLK